MNDPIAGVRGEALPPAGAGQGPAGVRGKAPSVFPPLVEMSLAMLLVGATAPLGEVALAGIPLFPTLAVRLALAGAALAVLGKKGPGQQPHRLLPRHWAILAFQALCGVIVFNAGLWLGMRVLGAAGAGVFTSATPAVMAALGMLAFGERPTVRTVAGIGLTIAGVLAARNVPGLDWRPGPNDALLLAAVAGEAVFLLALKWLPKWLSPMAAAKRVTWLGLAMVLPLAVAQCRDFDPAGAGLEAWLAVAALGVLVTGGGYVLWFRGVGQSRPSQAAAVTGLMPVSAVMSSWLLLGQTPSAGQGLGCLAVGAGIWLATRRQ